MALFAAALLPLFLSLAIRTPFVLFELLSEDDLFTPLVIDITTTTIWTHLNFYIILLKTLLLSPVNLLLFWVSFTISRLLIWGLWSSRENTNLSGLYLMIMKRHRICAKLTSSQWGTFTCSALNYIKIQLALYTRVHILLGISREREAKWEPVFYVVWCTERNCQQIRESVCVLSLCTFGESNIQPTDSEEEWSLLWDVRVEF